MDVQVEWSSEALADVESIAEYIARDSAVYTKAVVESILETAESLHEFPFRGRTVPELGQESVRERFVYSYRLIYRVQNGMVTIAAVVHGKRMLDSVRELL
jgi:addiction module RelE/StbE family toxin